MTSVHVEPMTLSIADQRAAARAGVYVHDTSVGGKVAVVFPGHGSQYVDMGASLFSSSGTARELLKEADTVTSRYGGFKVSEQFLTSFGGKEVAERLTTPAAMQCSIFVMSMAIHEELVGRGLRADYYAGHSLGELAALTASGVLSFGDGLRAVLSRAAAVSRLTGEGAGAMASVRVADAEQRGALHRVLLRARAHGPVAEVIENTPDQVVVSGATQAVDLLVRTASTVGLAVTRLKASHAFHSQVLTECAEALTASLEGLTTRLPRVPVLSSILMDYYRPADVPDLPGLLGQQLVTPFSFRNMLNRLSEEGVGVFVEAGPSAVLTRLVEANGVPAMAVAVDRRRGAGPLDLDEAVTAVGTVRGTLGESVSLAPARDSREDDVQAIVARVTGYPVDLVLPRARLGTDLGIVASAREKIRSEVLRKGLDTGSWPVTDGVAADVSVLEIIGLPDRPGNDAGTFRGAAAVQGSAGRAGGPGGAVAGGVVDRVDLVRSVTEVFASRTGYPLELIEPGLDLEGDLGVDSVKQAEVWVALEEQFGPAVGGLRDEGLATIDAIVDAMIQRGAGGETEERPPSSGGERPRPETQSGPADLAWAYPPVDGLARRYVPELFPAVVEAARSDRALSDSRFLVITDNRAKLAVPVIRALIDAGSSVAAFTVDDEAALRVKAEAGTATGTSSITVTRADITDALNMIEVCAGVHAELGQVNGLLDLSGWDTRRRGFDSVGDDWAGELDAAFLPLFVAVREVYADLKRAGADATVAVVTRTGGGFGYDLREAGNPLGAVGIGFVKSLARELPDGHVRAIDLAPGLPDGIPDPQKAALRVLDELRLAEADDGVEIAYIGDERFVVKVLPEPVDVDVPRHRLTPQDTVVFSGGSRGIALECLVELARRTGAHVVVLGRTDLDASAHRRFLAMADDEFVAARQDIVLETKRQNPGLTPLEIEQRYRRLENARTLARNLRVRFAGLNISYESCDVTDHKSVSAVARKLRAEGRTVRGVVHAAGLESFGSAPKKPFEHSREVVRVKGVGMHHLWHAFHSSDLQFFYSFGSISGRFGMDGQVDYTAGSFLISALSAHLSRSHPDVDVKTLGWTAWGEVGMAEQPQVRAVQEGRGLEYIGVEEGVSHFLAELGLGTGRPDVLLFGALGSNEPPGQMTLLTADRRAMKAAVDRSGNVLDRRNIPALDTVTVASDRVEATRRLDVVRDHYLVDHHVKGVATYPGVMHVESMVEAAQFLVGPGRAIRILDVDLLRFLKVPRNRPVDIAISAEFDETSGAGRVRCSLTSDVRTPDGVVLEVGRENSRARLETVSRPHLDFPGDAARALLRGSTGLLDVDRFYDLAKEVITFGPTFRYLQRAVIDGDTVAGAFRVPHRLGLFSDNPCPRFLTSPIVLDNVGRLILLHSVHTRGRFLIPVHIQDADMVRALGPGEDFTALVRILEPSGDEPAAEMLVADAEGAPVLRVGRIDFVTIASAGHPLDLRK